MKLSQLVFNEERTVTPSRPILPVAARPEEDVGIPAGAQAAQNDAGGVATEAWDGVERRSNQERRSSDRRQQGKKGPLDTRSGDDRRHYGRRATDPPPAGRLKIKV